MHLKEVGRGDHKRADGWVSARGPRLGDAELVELIKGLLVDGLDGA